MPRYAERKQPKGGNIDTLIRFGSFAMHLWDMLALSVSVTGLSSIDIKERCYILKENAPASRSPAP